MANSGYGNCSDHEENSFLYFAYGSNLLKERIHLQNPSAAFCCVACLQVICMGAKENGLPLEYQKKLKAIESNDFKGKLSEEIEDMIKKGETKTKH
ncbi:gamma-glutamylcyclotransferase isoform X2 [Trichechus manatus latirostris]|uniref:gamma-glutamylcyclotransferase n=1 Tax=Trichechus manatus latirostris TaxID=127582 RepID=A0A2Y9G0J7_TRIMA|nr:gamma-glutamylcyclotransferase isoform X2 [Trichechus manatus latirostris]